MAEHKSTFCRICEPGCPIKANFNDSGELESLKPNYDHPTGGIPCHKGLSFMDLHYSKDRLNYPMKRTNPRSEPTGNFERVSWEEAFGDIGTKLRELREKYGPNAIAFFSGNPGVFDSRHLMSLGKLSMGSGTKMLFNSGTQDMTNKLRGCYDLYGSNVFLVPDLAHTNYFLCIGANPKVSHWTILSQPNDSLSILKKLKARGGKTLFINPRKTESSTSETGETLLIKPGTDVYFLAALINEIALNDDIDHDHVAKHGKNIDGLLDFAKQYPAGKVSNITGIDEATIKQVAKEFAAAEGASAYMSLGVNQGGQGMLGYWLVEMLSFITGNLGKKGGTYAPKSSLKPKLALDVTKLPTFKTAIGDLPTSPPGVALPSVLLPDLIESGEIKALLVFGGNPILSVGGENQLRNAFEKLELVVSTDIMLNATGELADYVLPGSSWLERADTTFISDGMQAVPHIQYTDAMVPLTAERKPDWWIDERFAQELGVPSMLDDDPDTDGFNMVRGALKASGLTLEKIKNEPHQTYMVPDPINYESFYELHVLHEDKKVDCYPAAFSSAGLFERCANMFEEFNNEPSNVLKLSSYRSNSMHNTWMIQEKLRKGTLECNPLYMNPKDAASRGLFDGDEIRVFNQHGSVITLLRVDENMREGAVVMSHGYSNTANPHLSAQTKSRGANVNQLMPIDSNTYEPLSHMSRLCAVNVEVEKI